MPYITYDCGGRLGNCIFPFFFCIFFEMKFGYTYSVEDHYPQTTITDDMFREMITEEKALKNEIHLPPTNIRLWGFFQYDWLFKHFRKELLEYVGKNPKVLNVQSKSLNRFLTTQDLLQDSLPNVNPKENDIVVHLRLEDAVEDHHSWIIHPNDYDAILQTLSYDTIYWVLNEPILPVEKQYLEYFLKKYGGVYTPRSILEDMSLMRKAHRLICSRSTLSWTSSYFSFHEKQIVWMPKNPGDFPHEICNGIYPETHLFEIHRINKTKCEQFLNSTTM